VQKAGASVSLDGVSKLKFFQSCDRSYESQHKAEPTAANKIGQIVVYKAVLSSRKALRNLTYVLLEHRKHVFWCHSETDSIGKSAFRKLTIDVRWDIIGGSFDLDNLRRAIPGSGLVALLCLWNDI
jgi:hypothetical protein